jgi:hypothetical protein
MPPGKAVGFTQMTERPSRFAESAATTAPDESPYTTISYVNTVPCAGAGEEPDSPTACNRASGISIRTRKHVKLCFMFVPFAVITSSVPLTANLEKHHFKRA